MVLLRILVLTAWLIAFTGADACSIPHTSAILHDTRAYAQSAAIVARAQVSALRIEDTEGIEAAEFRVERVYRGSAPRTLQVRYRNEECVRRPPLGQDIYLFVFATDAQVSRLNFIYVEGVPGDFEANLGASWAPLAGRNNLPPRAHPRLAPANVPSTAITRIEAGVTEERWSVQLLPVRHWAIARFYIRLPNAFVFFEPEYVTAAAHSWGDPDLQSGVLSALPLKAPTDLYQFALMGRMPRPADATLDRFLSDALISGKAIVLAISGGYLDAIRITRTSQREQLFASPTGFEILRTRW